MRDKIDPDYFSPVQSTAQVAETIRSIRHAVIKYAQQWQLRSFVLGISGGVDSALCAALLKPVCRELDIAFIGRSITIETNQPDEIRRSVQVGEHFCSDFAYLDLTNIYLENKKLLPQLTNSALSKLRQGNLKARMRMVVLYDLAQLYRGIVISTDNFTEYLTGFWTLHGDVGDFAPIQHLWKTEVYALANYLLQECNPDEQNALQACIDATPVDGLGISANDCEQLGVKSYFEADRILKDYFSGNYSTEMEIHQVIKKYHASLYKRKHPASVLRKTLINTKKIQKNDK